MNDKEFEKRNTKFINSMSKDRKFKEKTKDWSEHSWKYEYLYHFRWLGLPIIQFPQDIMAIQELIWKVKPDLIIETGIARGGSLIFSSSILEMLGHGKVLGIDIDIRKHNKIAIQNHPLFKRIKMIEGSSVDPKTIKKVKSFAKNKKKILLLLDSKHTHEHVLNELRSYSSLVNKGGNIIVFDTMVEDMPKNSFPDRPWDKENNPKTAVKEFLKENKRFKIDKDIEDKLLITSCPSGYLKCIK